MKLLPVSLAVLLAGSAAGSGYLWHTSNVTRTALEAEINAARGEVADLTLAHATLSARLSEADTELARIRAANAERDRLDALAQGLSSGLARLAATVNTDLAGAWTQAAAAQEALFASPSPESRDAFRKALEAAAAQARSTGEVRAELAAFIDTNATELAAHRSAELEAARTRVASADASITRATHAVGQTLASLRDVPFTALASEDWRTTTLDVGDGEVVAVAAEGTWRWSPVMGNAVDASGQPGPASMRVDREVGNGALLVRMRGSTRTHMGVGGILPDRRGQVEVRINDTTTTDNDGAMDLTLIAFRPLS
jgi:hypothetical protein